MKNPYFGRLITAMVTLFNEDGSVNVSRTAEFAEWLIENGSNAILVCGTTGESPTISTEEKKELYAAVVKKINHRAPVIVGTGSNDTAATIKMTQMAESLGVDGALCVGPYYNKPTQEGFYQHFKAIAHSTKLPLIIYNIPGRTGTNILPTTMARIAKDCPNVVAIKEAAGNVAQTAELYRVMPKDFSIYSGDDGMILPFLSVGATGLISVLSNVGGQLLQELIQSYENGEVQKAKDLFAKMVPQAKAMFMVTNPIPIKEAVTMLTPFNAGPYRLPMCPMNAEEKEKFKKLLIETGLKK